MENGDTAIGYDPDNPTAGDEREGSPQLGIVSSDGEVTDWELPVVGGQPVPPTSLPVATTPDSSVVVYDNVGGRLLLRSTAGDWELLASLSTDFVQVAPQVAVATDGTLRIATTTTVLRLLHDGTTTRVAGLIDRPLSSISFPEPPLLALPLPGLQVSLPLITGLVVDSAGVTFLSTQRSVLSRHPTGLLTLVLQVTQAGLEMGGRLVRVESFNEYEGPLFTGLAIDANGRLNVLDTGRQRMLRLGVGTLDVVIEGVSSISDGAVVGRFATELLVSREGGKVVCSYDND